MRGDPFTAFTEELGDIIAAFIVGGVLIVAVVTLAGLAFVAFDIYKHSQGSGRDQTFSPWEEPGDASGLWFPDGNLYLGEEVTWS